MSGLPGEAANPASHLCPSWRGGLPSFSDETTRSQNNILTEHGPSTTLNLNARLIKKKKVLNKRNKKKLDERINSVRSYVRSYARSPFEIGEDSPQIHRE